MCSALCAISLQALLKRVEMAKKQLKHGNVMSNCGRKIAIAFLDFLTGIN